MQSIERCLTTRLLLCFFVLVLCSGSAAALSIRAYKVLVVMFDVKSSSLREADRKNLANVLNEIRKEDWCTLHVVIAIGHADGSEGALEETQALSEQRAASVRAFLMQSGIPEKGIYTEGKGVSQPGAAPSTAIKNARVELEFLGMPGEKDCRYSRDTSGFRIWWRNQ